MTKFLCLVALLLVLIVGSTAEVRAQTTDFTFQGNLKDGANPANGNYDFTFQLFDAVSNGTQFGPTLLRPGVAVENGVFSVRLDFGGQFPGANRFLEIRVRPAGNGAYTPLAPRPQVLSSPYSVQSLNAVSATNTTQLGGVPASQYVLTTDFRLSDARPPTAGSSNYIQNTSSPQASSNFNISDTGTAKIFNATTQFSIGGSQVLSVAGASNIFAGVGAGTANTGAGNTFIGAVAGDANVTGGNNTIVGAGADVGSGALNFATALGADAIVNASNTVVLGRAADTVQVPGSLTVTGTLTGSGTGITNLNASSITSGTLADARLSGNIPRLNAANAFGNFTNTILGNVGIGTTAPSARLHVVGTSWFTGNTTPLPSSAGAGVGIVHSNGTGYVFAYDYASSTPQNLALNASGGNVGIGTASPARRLHVQNGSAGAIAPSSSSSVVLEGSANNFLQIFSPAANESGLLFGSPSLDIRASIVADVHTLPTGDTFAMLRDPWGLPLQLVKRLSPMI